MDDLLRHLLGHGRGRRAGADGVLEGERRGEARGLDDAERLLEVLFGLAREPDDDVGGDGGVRDAGANAVEDAEELLGPVGPPHRLEDAVGTRLQRHVQLRHDGGRLGHGVDDVVGERRRVRAREADALEPVDPAGGAEQLAERLPVAELDPVGVDVLAEQGDLDAPSSTSAWISARISPGRRSFSLPRSAGTMQNVQVLLQPTEMDTQPL